MKVKKKQKSSKVKTSLQVRKKVKTLPLIQPVVAQAVMDQAAINPHWKAAFITGKNEQIVFMNVSLKTTLNNEIGMEVHPFDQLIFIVQGKAIAILDGKENLVSAGDMIFIPEGTAHNVINLDRDVALKLVSFYSSTDIPSGAIYKTKADEPNA